MLLLKTMLVGCCQKSKREIWMNIWKCVKSCHIIFEYETVFISVPNSTFVGFIASRWSTFECLFQNIVFQSMFPTRSSGQNDRIGRTVIPHVCENLDFVMGLATKILIFPALSPPVFAFSLSMYFVLQEVCFQYVKCISCLCSILNVANILTRFDRLILFTLAGWSHHFVRTLPFAKLYVF